jgi:hypothetical protein
VAFRVQHGALSSRALRSLSLPRGQASRGFCCWAAALSLAIFAPQRGVRAQTKSAASKAVALRDGSHDFDFEIGSWKAHISRLVKPLSGANTWVEYDGTSVVRAVWNGRANLGELEVQGSAGRIEGLSLRLYDPTAHQWRISWANANDGQLGTPMVGGFANGRGEFYDQEAFNGRAIYVRFIFSGMTAKSFKIEQAFSDDGGKTWETNWISTFTR